MSYTFLPNSEQANMKREYRVRALIVLFFFVSVAFVVGIASLFPAYISSNLEESLHLSQVAALQKNINTQAVNSIQKQLNSSSGLFTAVSDSLQNNIYSKTIATVVGLKGSVLINSISIELPSATSLTVAMTGVAPTRSDLLAFKSRLQGLTKTTVDLPISTLAQDKNVTFSIQVKETL